VTGFSEEELHWSTVDQSRSKHRHHWKEQGRRWSAKSADHSPTAKSDCEVALLYNKNERLYRGCRRNTMTILSLNIIIGYFIQLSHS